VAATSTDLPKTTVFHRMPTESETAIVAFSSHGTRADRFHFFRLGEFVPDASKLLVRDPADSWYNAGLPGAGDTVEEIAAAIEAELAAMGARRAIAVGSSMGAYAAILFGCLIGAERVVAQSPQTLLDPGLPHWTPPAGVRLQAPDLGPIVRETPLTKVDVVIGLDELMDVFHAQRIASAPSVRVLGVPESGHAFPKKLHARDEYWPFLTALIDGETPSMCTVEPEFPPGIEQQVVDIAFAWGRGEQMEAMEALAAMARRYPEWVPPRHALAKALAHTPRRGEAGAW
jgi:pimeloyl-ACP methyl ester carboxylesterase